MVGESQDNHLFMANLKSRPNRNFIFKVKREISAIPICQIGMGSIMGTYH